MLSKSLLAAALAISHLLPASLAELDGSALASLTQAQRQELEGQLSAWKSSPAAAEAVRMGLTTGIRSHRSLAASDATLDQLERLLANQKVIEDLRKRQPRATFSLTTPFALMTPDEFKAFVDKDVANDAHRALMGGASTDSDSLSMVHARELSDNGDRPKDVDWEKAGCVTRVKNQGSCSVCWAFAAVATLESNYCINSGGSGNKTLIEFAQQDIVSCGPREGKCWAGFAEDTYEWMTDKSGGQICSYESFPYTSEGSTVEPCRACKKIDTGIVTYHARPYPDHQDLERVVAKRPVAANVLSGVPVFQHYTGGVLMGDEQLCPSTGFDHVVSIVGYGERDGAKFWKVKNSWGTWWGDKGYIYLERGYQGGKMGACGIESMGVYPIFRNEVPWLEKLQCEAVRVGVEITGQDLKTVIVKDTTKECCDACRREPGCKGATWTFGVRNKCNLKATIDGEQWVEGASSVVIEGADPTPAPGQCLPVENDVDYFGNDIASAPAKTASACCGRCANNARCNAYTWTKFNGGTCFLKSGKGNAQRKDKASDGSSYFVSGQVDRNGPTPTPTTTPTPSPSTDAQCLPVQNNADYFGNDVANAPAASVADCCGLCSKNAKCNAYTWTKWYGGSCYMKSAKGDVVMKSPSADGSPYFQSGEILRTQPTPTPPTPTTTTPTPAPTPNEMCLPTEDNIDYYGNDLAVLAARTVGDCCTHCTDNMNCGAYTWSTYNGGMCYLKPRKANVQRKQPAPDGSPVVRSGEVYRCQPLQSDTNFPNEDIGNAPAPRTTDCCALCRGRTGCSAFSWSNYQGGTCWLKKRAAGSERAVGVISARV